MAKLDWPWKGKVLAPPIWQDWLNLKKAKATTSPRKILRLVRQNISFVRKLKKGLKPFSKDQPNAEIKRI